jgi:hypothetical protein
MHFDQLSFGERLDQSRIRPDVLILSNIDLRRRLQGFAGLQMEGAVDLAGPEHRHVISRRCRQQHGGLVFGELGGTAVTVADPQPGVRRILEITGLLGLFTTMD